jgi:hypothetical protein
VRDPLSASRRVMAVRMVILGAWSSSPPNTPPRHPLFETYSPERTAKGTFSRAQASNASYRTGYFAFPPNGSSNHIEPPPAPFTPSQNASELDFEDSYESPESRSPSPTASPGIDDMRASAAAEGEREWVRSGGLLRDASGKIDHARTEATRSEIAAADALAAAKVVWTAYEERWRLLVRDQAQGRTDPLTWEDIPWPSTAATKRWIVRRDEEKEKAAGSSDGREGVALFTLSSLSRPKVEREETKPLITPLAGQPAVSVASNATNDATQLETITMESLEAFLLDPLSLGLRQSGSFASLSKEEKDTIKASKAVHHRVRREMLHWHSDKFDMLVLGRIPEEDEQRERIIEDAGKVWRWLSAHGGRSK